MLPTTSRAEMPALARIADSLGTSEDVAEVPDSGHLRWRKGNLRYRGSEAARIVSLSD
jgi:hypothetical protein